VLEANRGAIKRLLGLLEPILDDASRERPFLRAGGVA
jgi:hypothetical protein